MNVSFSMKKGKGKKGKGHCGAVLGLCALLLFNVSTSFAQNHLSQSFLNVTALHTSTNGYGITNLAAVTSITNQGMIYVSTNLTFTNAGSVQHTLTAAVTNSTTTFPIYKTVSLFTDRDGKPIVFTVPSGSADLTNFAYSGANVFIEVVNTYGSNAPMGVTFCPLWDGVTYPASTADDWGFRIAGLATAKNTLATNVPLWRWPGAKALGVRSVTNQYILAGNAVETNSPAITKLQFNGFRP